MTAAANHGGNGVEPLDARLGGVSVAAGATARGWTSRMRLALGLSPTPRPGLILIPLGIALGPHGLGILTDPVLTTIDPAVSVALAALGAFVGLDLDVRRARDGVLLAAASLEACVTFAAVAGGALLLQHYSSPQPAAPWLLAALLGICAAPSSTVHSARADRTRAARIGDLDDVLPIVLGVLALAAARNGAWLAILSLTGRSLLVAATIALAGWLLVSRTSSITEERVFAIGSLLLLGGAAAYLSLSALFAGLVAGLVWQVTGAQVRDRLTRDLRYLQHPLIALLLLVAGARMNLTTGLATLIGVYVVCRTAAKLAGGWLAGLIAGYDRRDLGLSLISPGVVGIAFALNVLQARGESGDTGPLLAVVIAGSLASDVLAHAARERETAP